MYVETTFSDQIDEQILTMLPATSAGYGRQQRPTYSDNERTFSGAFGRGKAHLIHVRE